MGIVLQACPQAFLLLKGKLDFPPESAPPSSPRAHWLRPEAEELGRLRSKRTAMPRETTACQLPPASPVLAPQTLAQSEGRRTGKESQIMSPSQGPLPVPSTCWSPRGKRRCQLPLFFPYSLLLAPAFPGKGKRGENPH